MAKTSNLNIRIDPDVKDKAEALFSNFGMNISDAINIFLHQCLIYGGLPFDVKIDKPNADTIAAMEEINEMMRTGKGKKYNSIDDLFKELNS